MRHDVADAVAAGTIGGRLWFYTNYHCNLACRYCLTESQPNAMRRILTEERIVAAADDAVRLGFTSFGVTGGEPFLLRTMPSILMKLCTRLPTVVLTNGTLFSQRLIGALRAPQFARLSVQISLDSGDERENDAMRAAGNFTKVVETIRTLRDAGLHVKIGSTVEDNAPPGFQGLCELHRALGIDESDHVVRPIVRRGRAERNGLGIAATMEDLPAELTLTSEGAYWSPAAPTVTGSRLDTDLLLTRRIAPLETAVAAMLRLANAPNKPRATKRVA
jgi:MoaA/NifB/PqqE/SkfB family radical SAM enzyme